MDSNAVNDNSLRHFGRQASESVLRVLQVDLVPFLQLAHVVVRKVGLGKHLLKLLVEVGDLGQSHFRCGGT